MPFTVTTNDGITVENIPDDLEPDSPEVRQRVEAARAQRDSEDQEGLGIGGILAGGANILASGAVEAGTQAIEGLSGLGGLVAGRGVEQSVESAQALSGQIPQIPLGEDAQALIADISERFQAAPDLVQEIFGAIANLGPSVGESVFQATGSPLGASLAGAIPGLLETATGLRGPAALARAIPERPGIEAPQQPVLEVPQQTGVDIPPAGFPGEGGAPLPQLPVAGEGLPAPQVAPQVGPQVAPAAPLIEQVAEGIFNFQTPEKIRIGELIEEGSTDIDTARFKVEQGRTKTDRKAIEAEKQGFDPGSLAMVKASPKPDKFAFGKMVDIMEKAKNNLRFGTENRPSDIPGKSLSDRLDFIKRVNRIAGFQIDRVARDKLKNKPVEFERAQNRFFNELNKLRVTFDDKGEPIFKGSDIQGLPGAENIVKKILARMDRDTIPDAEEIHKVKSFIDTQVKFGKAQEGLADEGLRIAKQLRFDLNKSLQDTFPEYAEVNKKFSDTKQALDNFEDFAGTKIKIGSPNFDKFAGTLLRRLSGNAVSRIPLFNSIIEIEKVTKSLGKKFKGDIITQTLWSDELDEVFGPVARKSFGGEIGSEIKRGAQLIRSPEQAALEGVALVADKARGIDQKGAFKAIRALLNE